LLLNEKPFQGNKSICWAIKMFAGQWKYLVGSKNICCASEMFAGQQKYLLGFSV